MSVPNQTPYIIYNANGLTTVFPFEFYIINAGDIQVSLNGAVITTGYSVSGVGNVGGGDVTFLTPPANGTVVMLERVVPTYRLTDYQDNGDLLADTVNKDFDRLWMAIQRSFIYLGLALRRPLFGGPYDAEGYRISHLADPVDDQDAATKKWVLEKESANLNRALRVPENSVQPIPPLSERANKLLAFNDAGQPIAVLPPSGSASDVLIDLARPNGALLVGGAILECSTVAQAQAIVGLTEGRKVRTYYYNVPVVTDWVFTTTQPAAPTFYINAVGGYLILMTPNFASAGIIPGAYDPQVAWGNRNKITKLYFDTRFSVFTDGCNGVFHNLGSIVPNRSNIKTVVGAGFTMLGHYDDPSVPESIGSNTGAMFDFVLRANYHINGDYTNTGQLQEVHFDCYGDIGTVFSSTHSKLHNNNVIGAYNIKNSSFKVHGRITSSDHRGICIDGLADNVYVYLADASNCSNEPLVLRPSLERTCRFKIGSVHDCPFDGDEKTVITTGGGYAIGSINTFRWDGITKPVLARCLTGQGLLLKPGRIYGVQNGLRQYETPIAEINGGIFSGATTLLAKVTPGGTVRTSSAIKNVTVLDALTNVYSDESGNTKPYRLEISGCDLVRAGASVVLFAGKTTTGTPEVQVLKDNNVHASMVTAEWNLYTSAGATVTLTGTSATIPVSRNYSFCIIAVNDNSTLRRVTIDLRAAEVSTTGFAYVLSTNAGLTATYGSNSVGVVVSGTAVSLVHYVLHN